MDITSLYTNIQHNEGINSVADILKLFSHDKDFIDEIKSCIYFILKNNIFTFNEQNYIQVSGTAMRTKMAPKYASSFMAKMEKSLFATLNKLPKCHFRFLDDIFIIWTNGQEFLNEFLNLTNNIYPLSNLQPKLLRLKYIFSIPLFICKTIKSKPKFTASQLMPTSILFPNHAIPVTLPKTFPILLH